METAKDSASVALLTTLKDIDFKRMSNPEAGCDGF